MSPRYNRIHVSLRLTIFLFIIVVFATPSQAADDKLPATPEKAILIRVCTTCHDVSAIPRLRHTRGEWQDLVDSMRGMGAEGSDQDFEAIVDYLTANFGAKEQARININKAMTTDIETGIGLAPKEAAAIVDYRRQHGNFMDWNDLVKVEGVDKTKLEAVKNRIDY